MKVLIAAAEVAPLTKVGGLADVVGSLPVELIGLGHDVRVIVPKYGFVDYSPYKMTPVINGLTVLSLQEYRKVSVEQTTVGDIEVYLVSTDVLARSGSVYGENELEKFWVFCDAVCGILPYLGWQPDILHCHDWHTALLPLLARVNKMPCRSVFTIHNIKYQGYFDESFLSRSGLRQYWLAGLPRLPQLPWNLMAQGILWADVINAVSETFSREILTAEYGYGAQDILNFRKERLFGIRNGLGYEEYDPAADKLIAANYDSSDIGGKWANKKKILQSAGWKMNPDIPLVGMVSRLDEQKGLDIILEAIPEILSDLNVQFVFLGRGKEYYETMLRSLETRFPGNVKAFITFDNAIAHLIYAGSDMFLMPSQWEPCGLGQLIAMRYGSLPIVRKTGGLADTVFNLSADLKRGSGFVFKNFDHGELVEAVKKAVAAFENKAAWERAVERVMELDFSWREPVRKYESLYKRALEYDINDPL
ncbi:MAG: glycogen/starch synthase [Dehalococcoidia bacterium]|jgi:starch synthase